MRILIMWTVTFMSNHSIEQVFFIIYVDYGFVCTELIAEIEYMAVYKSSTTRNSII